VATPLGLLLVPFLQSHHEELGAAAAPSVLVLFLALEGLCWHIVRLLPVPEAVRAWAAPAALGLALVWTVAALLGYEAGTPVARALERAFIVQGGATLERRASDIDRDGFSSLLGGGDCAAFDGERNPAAVDIPGNGLDEDCDGADDEPADDDGRVRRVAYGRLEARQVRRYNVVWIIVDAMRADHTGMLGYKRPTTPYIDALAKESLLFANARSQSSGTDMSIPSMLAGQDPGVMDWDTRRPFYGLGKGVLPLAERLSEHGWHSGIFVNAWINKNVGDYGRGYDVAQSLYPLKEWKTWSKRSSPLVTTRAIEFVEGWIGRGARGKEPFFLTLYYEDPHHTYERHTDKGHAQFGNRDVDRFDGEIAFADRYVGMLLEYLRHKPDVWKNTIVVVTADHGEEFKEHGGRFHNRTCYEESIRVPLVVRVPGLAPRRIATPVALLDVVPAVLELVGLPVEGDPRLSGQSVLVPALAPDDVDPERPITCSVHSKSKGDNAFKVRAVVSGDWKLVHNLKENSHELYNLAKDPKEKKNLIWDEEHGGQLARLERLLKSTLRAPKAAGGAAKRAEQADSR
jgi:arylsulfatase A-like enzyme